MRRRRERRYPRAPYRSCRSSTHLSHDSPRGRGGSSPSHRKIRLQVGQNEQVMTCGDAVRRARRRNALVMRLPPCGSASSGVPQNRRYGLFGMVHRRFWGMDRGLAKTSPNIVGQSRPRVSIAIKPATRSAGGRGAAGPARGGAPGASRRPGRCRDRRERGGRAHPPSSRRDRQAAGLTGRCRAARSGCPCPRPSPRPWSRSRPARSVPGWGRRKGSPTGRARPRRPRAGSPSRCR